MQNKTILGLSLKDLCQKFVKKHGYWLHMTLYTRILKKHHKTGEKHPFAVHVSPSIFGILTIRLLHTEPIQK